jgi:hypothetical protein
VNSTLHERVRRMRERALIRTWEYLQRNYAKGVWFRFRRVLVDAAQAWIVDDRDADRIESEGSVPLSIGGEFDPPKRLFFLTVEQLAAVSSRRRVPVRLCCEVLQARNLVLIAHE